MLFFLLAWLIFGLLVGFIAKFLHPGDEPVGFGPTLAIGVVGSFVGGGINWLLSGGSGGPLQASGFIMSIIGGVITCAAYRYYKLKFADGGPRGFISGKRK
jgi:uncharacterized membrane protein YeaQ/YmgE (transglycosylase-associated protein family)